MGQRPIRPRVRRRAGAALRRRRFEAGDFETAGGTAELWVPTDQGDGGTVVGRIYAECWCDLSNADVARGRRAGGFDVGEQQEGLLGDGGGQGVSRSQQ